MTTATILSPEAFASALEEYYAEAYDDMRKVIVGTQAASQQAEIYARHSHLFTLDQANALRDARDAATEGSDEREIVDRLWLSAAAGVAEADVVEASEKLLNDRLAWRTTVDGEEMSSNALSAALAAESDFDRREMLHEHIAAFDEAFSARTVELRETSQRLRDDVYGTNGGGEIAIAEMRTRLDLHALSNDLLALADRTRDAFEKRADVIFPRLLGREIATPDRAHVSYMRSLHVHDDVFTADKLTEACGAMLADLGLALDSIPAIRPDLDDRPEKNPRACVIPVRAPGEVHLIVRPTGGLDDYQAFLHEAGHAVHYALANPSLPTSYRLLSRDHALTEIFSYIFDRVTFNPAWHARYMGVSDERAEQIAADARFIDAGMYRRYAAKLAYELEFWKDPTSDSNPTRYAERLSSMTRTRYSTSSFASDMDAGLYAADYLRAWRTSMQVIAWLENNHGPEWFAQRAAGDTLRELYARGTQPTNEDISLLVGAGPDNFDALERHLSA